MNSPWQVDLEEYDDLRWPSDMGVMRDLVNCKYIDLQVNNGEAYQVRYFQRGYPLLEPERMYPFRRKGSKCLWLKAEVRDSPNTKRIVYAKFHHLVYLTDKNLARIPYGKDVHHKDTDIYNNRISNLEALTKEEHRALHRKKGAHDNLNNKPTIARGDPVVATILELHASGLSLRDIAKQVNLSHMTVQRIIKGIYPFKGVD